MQVHRAVDGFALRSTFAATLGLRAACVTSSANSSSMTCATQRRYLLHAETCPESLRDVTSNRIQGSIKRQVDHRGFAANLFRFQHADAPETLAMVSLATTSDHNILLCGSKGTGKLTCLKAMGDALRQTKGLHVAFTSFDPKRANIMGGIIVHTMLGLRVNSDELPIQEQMEGTFERHVRLVDSVYENSIYSISTCDVLVLDSLHLCSTVIIKALDSVCRRVRGKPLLPFGGLRVLASADFWAMRVHPASDHGGYVFQLPEWDELFPVQQYLERIHGQDPSLGRITDSALMGTLSGSETTKLLKHCVDAATANHRQFVKMIDTSSGMLHFQPRFPKQPAIFHNPSKAVQIKRVEIGNFLINMLYQSSFAERYGMLGKLSLEVGTRVHLIYPLLHPRQGRGGSRSGSPHSDQVDVDIPAGVCGEVIHIFPHRITVSFPTLHRTVDIPRTRISAYHTNYPELTYAVARSATQQCR